MTKIMNNFRVRITLIIFILSAVISTSFAYFSYKTTKEKLFLEFQNRLKNIAYTASLSIDPTVLDAVLQNMTKIPKVTITDIEKSPTYAALSQQLNEIKNIQPGMVRYIYIMLPTTDQKKSLFVIDADTLGLLEDARKGEIVTEKIDHVNSTYDMSGFPIMQNAFQQQLNLVESEISFDSDYNTWSLSGFAPIKHNGRFYAMIGIDVSADTINDYFKTLTRNYIIAIVIVLLLSSLVALFLGKTIADPIITLDKAMAEFAEKNFFVRVEPTTHDEVGDLYNSFNKIASTIQEYSGELMSNSQEILQSQEEISLLKTKLAQIINAIPSAIIALDKNLTIIHWNHAAEMLFGIKQYEAEGANIFSTLHFFMPHEHELQEAILNKDASRCMKITVKNTRLYMACMYQLDFMTSTGLVIRIDDITSIEKKERHDKFVRNMEVVSHLASGLTSDFNKIIEGFSGMMKLLKYKYTYKTDPPENDIRNVIAEIEDAGIRAEKMSGYLALFSQTQQLTEQDVNLNSVLNDVISTLSVKTSDVLVSFVPTLPSAAIKGDPSLLTKAFTCICDNAISAVKKNNNNYSTLMVTVKKVNKEETYSQNTSLWNISFTDNGIGMNEELLNKVMTPFFSTDAENSGLGLPMASAIIQMHKGFIDIYSEKEKGTTVNIYLPCE